MTAEIINLRRARKARARLERDREAAQNRARFGRAKVERASQEAEADLAARRLDGAKRDTPDNE
jgi:hypothetical protein